MLNQTDELFREIHVGAFEGTGRHCCAATARGSSERRRTAVARLDPEVLTCATEAVVRAELGDRELRNRELLTIGVKTHDDALTVDADSGEVAGGVAVLALARNRRRRRELRRAVEARAAVRNGRTKSSVIGSAPVEPPPQVGAIGVVVVIVSSAPFVENVSEPLPISVKPVPGGFNSVASTIA